MSWHHSSRLSKGLEGPKKICSSWHYLSVNCHLSRPCDQAVLIKTLLASWEEFREVWVLTPTMIFAIILNVAITHNIWMRAFVFAWLIIHACVKVMQQMYSSLVGLVIQIYWYQCPPPFFLRKEGEEIEERGVEGKGRRDVCMSRLCEIYTP